MTRTTADADGTGDLTALPSVAGGAQRKEVRPGLFDAAMQEPPAPGERARLAASSCGHCGRVEFPARSRCPACDKDAQPVALSPDACLGAFTTVLHAVPGARIKPPYHVGVAQFSEGISVIGLLLASEGDNVRIGQSVETVVLEPFEGSVTYAFRLIPP
jgi:uncharacterized OB-fold protein